MTVWSRAAILGVGEAAQTAAPLVTVLVLTRAMEPTVFAPLAFLLLLYATGLTLGPLNVQHAVFWFVAAEKPDEARRLGADFTVWGAGGGWIMALAAWGAHWAGLGEAWGLGEGLLWLGLALLLEVPTTPLPQLLVAYNAVGAAALFVGVGAVGQTVAVVVPALASPSGQAAGAAAMALAGYAALRFAVATLLFIAYLPAGPFRPDWSRLRALAVYTLPLALAMMMATLNRQFDKYLVAAWFPPEVYAVYGVGAWELPFVGVLPYALGAGAGMALARAFQAGRREEAATLFGAMVERAALLVPAVACFLIAFAPQVVAVVFSPAYVDAAAPFAVYTVILFHRVAEYGLVLRAAGQPGVLFRASLLLGGVNIVASIPLTLWLGPVGAAWGTLIANVPAWLYVVAAIGGATGRGMGVFPWAFWGGTVALGVVAAVTTRVAVVSLAGGEEPTVALALGIPLFLALYGTMAWALGLYRRLRRVADSASEAEPAPQER